MNPWLVGIIATLIPTAIGLGIVWLIVLGVSRLNCYLFNKKFPVGTRVYDSNLKEYGRTTSKAYRNKAWLEVVDVSYETEYEFRSNPLISCLSKDG